MDKWIIVIICVNSIILIPNFLLLISYFHCYHYNHVYTLPMCQLGDISCDTVNKSVWNAKPNIWGNFHYRQKVSLVIRQLCFWWWFETEQISYYLNRWLPKLKFILWSLKCHPKDKQWHVYLIWILMQLCNSFVDFIRSREKKQQNACNIAYV